MESHKNYLHLSTFLSKYQLIMKYCIKANYLYDDDAFKIPHYLEMDVELKCVEDTAKFQTQRLTRNENCLII